MANKKERIMDLMRKGIITEDEAVELLEKSGESAEGVNETFSYTDKDGYENHRFDTGEQIKSALGQVGDSLRTAFTTIRKNVDENIDFSQGFPKVRTTDKQVEKDIEGDFQSISLDMKAGKISVKPGQNAHVKVEYKAYGSLGDGGIDDYIAKNSQLEVADGKLEIETHGRLAADIELYLPEREYEDLLFSTLYGEVKVEGLRAKHFIDKQVNGKMELKNSTIENLAVSGKNNTIKLEGSELGTVAVTNVNGEIVMTSNFENADLSNVNGTIRVTQTSTKARKLAVKNVNGEIKLAVPESLGLVGHVRTIFGGYKTRMRLDTPFEAGKNGSAVVRKGDETLTFDMEVKSGTIWLKDVESKENGNG